MSDLSGGNGTVTETESALVDFESALNEAWTTEEASQDEAVEVPVEDDVAPLEETEPVVDGDEPESTENDEPEEGDAVEGDEDRYNVKVNGEEFEVGVSELVDGYQRQSDYTQKTQLLAQEREELAPYITLAQTLADNPAAVVRAMAERFGVTLEGPAGTEAGDDVFGDLDPNDPVDRQIIALQKTNRQLEDRLNGIDSERQVQSESQRQAEVFSEIDSIKTEHSDADLVPGDLLQFAVDHKIGDLRMAYVAMKATTKVSEPAVIRKVQAKRRLQPVEGGSHRAGVVTGAPNGRMSIEDALAAALSE